MADGYLFGLQEQQPSSIVANEFENSSHIQISESIVGTGTSISLVINGLTLDTVSAVVLGDINGDGKVATVDYMMVKRNIINLYEFSDVQFFAADVNNDNSIRTTDYMKIKRHIAGSFILYV